MPDAAILAGPLEGLKPRALTVDGRSCTLADAPFSAMLTMRGNPGHARFVAAVLQATGMHLPLRANSASIDPQRQLLWLGPDEWMLKVRHDAAHGGAAIANALRQSLQGIHSAVVEVGDGSATLAVKGAAPSQ